MMLIDFLSHFPDEESCEQRFKDFLNQFSMICSECGTKDHYWKWDKEQ